jgi:hypothetical protein
MISLASSQPIDIEIYRKVCTEIPREGQGAPPGGQGGGGQRSGGDAQRQAVWKTLKNTKPPPTVAPQTAANTAPAADEPQGMVDKIM